MELRQALGWAVLAAFSAHAGAAALPDGTYGCYTYNPKANYVGEIVIAGARYSVAQFRTEGGYEYDSASGRMVFRGPPPLGFEAAKLETDSTSGAKILRLYPKPSDIGNKWKAAVCSPKKTVAPSSSSTASASATASNDASRSPTFKAGDKVTAEFIGVPYPATIVAAEPTRVRIRYDDPKSKDEWVAVNRIKLRK